MNLRFFRDNIENSKVKKDMDTNAINQPDSTYYEDTTISDAEKMERFVQRVNARYELHQLKFQNDPVYRKAYRKEQRKFHIYMFFHDKGTFQYYLLRKPVEYLKGLFQKVKKMNPGAQGS